MGLCEELTEHDLDLDLCVPQYGIQILNLGKGEHWYQFGNQYQPQTVKKKHNGHSHRDVTHWFLKSGSEALLPFLGRGITHLQLYHEQEEAELGDL